MSDSDAAKARVCNVTFAGDLTLYLIEVTDSNKPAKRSIELDKRSIPLLPPPQNWNYLCSPAQLLPGISELDGKSGGVTPQDIVSR